MAVGSLDPAIAGQPYDSSIPSKASRQSSVAVPDLQETTRSYILPSIAAVFHVTAAVITLSVFFYHFTPAAAKLPGARAFGWFFKFLTFWGWTTQTLQFLLCVVHQCTPKTATFSRAFTRFIDDFSCMAFTVAIVITVQFWVLHWLTGGLVERSQDRPPWLGFAVHVANACFALADVVLSNPRTFSPRSIYMMFGYVASYGSFLVLCRFKNGRYPYPFMNKLHPAAAFVTMLCVSLVVLRLISMGGAALSGAASRALSKQEALLVDASNGNGKLGENSAAKNNGKQIARRNGGPVLRNGKNSTKQH